MGEENIGLRVMGEGEIEGKRRKGKRKWEKEKEVG